MRTPSMTTRISRFHWAVTSLALWLGWMIVVSWAPAVMAQSVDGDVPDDLLLLRPADEKSAVEYRRFGPAVVEGRFVDVDPSAVEREAKSLRIEVDEGLSMVARRSDVERRGAGDVTWRGWLEAPDQGRVVLTLKNGGVTGTIMAAGNRYVIRALDGGKHGLERVEPKLFGACGSDEQPSSPLDLGGSFLGGPAPAGPLGGSEAQGSFLTPELALPSQLPAALKGGSEKAVSQIDLLALYTPKALIIAGVSEGTFAGWVQQAVDLANTASIDSQVEMRFRLVHFGLITDVADGLTTPVSLTQLRNSPQMQALRQAHGADLVGLVASNTDNFCGYARVMRSPGPSFSSQAVQATNILCLIGDLTWAHEHGHNMGLEHDPANGVPAQFASFPWSFGHFVSGSYRTIMSYRTECTTSCPDVPLWSNPTVIRNGAAAGIDGQRDNHRSLNLVRGIVAGFRGGGGGGGGGGGPAAPADLAVSRQRLRAILSWGDASSNESGFRIYRGVGEAALEQVAELPADSQEWVDDTLVAASTYRYQVSSFNSRGEKRGAIEELSVPALTPVSVEVSESVAATTGEPVSFTASFVGPVEEARWRFGERGVAFSPSPCEAGRVCASHLFFQPGTYAVTVEVIGDLGQTATATIDLVVVGAALETQTVESAVQSVLFGVRGATGTYETDCWLHNAGDAPLVFDVAYLERGAGNPHPDSYQLTLGARQTLTVPNVVSSLFERDSSQGALTWKALGEGSEGEPAAYGFCRSFVRAAGQEGTFGQLVDQEPAVDWSAEAKVVSGVEVGNGFTSTVLALNLDDKPGAVRVSLFDDDVQVGETAVFALGARTMRQRPVASLFPSAAAFAGPFNVVFESDNLRFAASATLLEDESEDQIFVVARSLEPLTPPVPAGPGVLVVPRVANGVNPFSSTLVSSMSIHNPSNSLLRLTIDFWERGSNNTDPRRVQIEVPANTTRRIADVLTELFGLEQGIGALHISWSNAEFVEPRIVTFALNNTGEGGRRFGTMVDSQPGSRIGKSSVIFGAEQSERFRSSLGIINFSAAGTRVALTLRDADGQTISSRTIVLKAQQHLERILEGIFNDVTLGSGQGWSIEAEVVGEGLISTYLASINVSGDLFFVPGQVR